MINTTTIKTKSKFNLMNNGSQLLSNLPDHSQSALEQTVLMELTAPEPSAVEPTDLSMDQAEPHALEKSQLPSLITTLNQPPDRDIKTAVTLAQPTHLLLTHLPQSQLLSSKLGQQKVPTKKQLPPSELDTTTRDILNQKKFSSLIQRSQEPTLASTPNNENEKS